MTLVFFEHKYFSYSPASFFLSLFFTIFLYFSHGLVCSIPYLKNFCLSGFVISPSWRKIGINNIDIIAIAYSWLYQQSYKDVWCTRTCEKKTKKMKTYIFFLMQNIFTISRLNYWTICNIFSIFHEWMSITVNKFLKIW